MNTLVYKACNRIWPFLHQQEPKGPQSWNQCQTNQVGFKMARQMKSWKQVILEEQSTQQNSTEQRRSRSAGGSGLNYVCNGFSEGLSWFWKRKSDRWQNKRFMLWMILCRFTWCDAVLWLIHLHLSSYIKTKKSNLFVFLQSCDKRYYLCGQ